MLAFLKKFLCITPNLYGFNILIVEDELSNLFIIRRILNSTNAQLFIARNGIEALKKLKANKNIDLVLMDLEMPVMDGYEATKIIKEENNKMIVIAVSGYSSENEKQRALDAGCDNYIIKPVNKRNLYKMLIKYLTPKNNNCRIPHLILI